MRSATPVPITPSVPGRRIPVGIRRQLVRHSVGDDRVPGLRPLMANDRIVLVTEQVDDLPLASSPIEALPTQVEATARRLRSRRTGSPSQIRSGRVASERKESKVTPSGRLRQPSDGVDAWEGVVNWVNGSAKRFSVTASVRGTGRTGSGCRAGRPRIRGGTAR